MQCAGCLQKNSPYFWGCSHWMFPLQDALTQALLLPQKWTTFE
jgi:hypothetical protein